MNKQSNLFEEFRGLILLFLIFGLWPSSRNSKINILLKIHSFFYICLIICILFLALYFKKLYTGHSLSLIVEYSYLCSIVITHTVIITEALVKGDAQIQIMQKISYIDYLFKNKLQMMISYRKEKHSIFIRVTVMVGVAFLIGVGLTIHLSYKNRITNFWYQCIFSVWVLRFRSIQIILFVFLFSTRLRLLRNKIREILPSQSFYNEVKNRWGFLLDDTKIVVLDSSSTKRSLHNRLLNLKQIYGELYEISEQINMTFGWSLITIIAQNFINFIGHSYWIFCSVKKSDYTHAIDCFLLLIPVITMLGTIVHYCSSCLRYVRLTRF